MQCFAYHGLRQYCMPDEAHDGQNIALKFSSDCWHARLSKAEFLHSFALYTCPPLGIVYESLTEEHTTMVLWVLYPCKFHLRRWSRSSCSLEPEVWIHVLSTYHFQKQSGIYLLELYPHKELMILC